MNTEHWTLSVFCEKNKGSYERRKELWNTTITFGSIVFRAGKITKWTTSLWMNEKIIKNLDNIVFALFNRKHEIVLYHSYLRFHSENCKISAERTTILVQLLYHKHQANEIKGCIRCNAQSIEVYIFNKQIICFRLKALKTNTCNQKISRPRYAFDVRLNQSRQSFTLIEFICCL